MHWFSSSAQNIKAFRNSTNFLIVETFVAKPRHTKKMQFGGLTLGEANGEAGGGASFYPFLALYDRPWDLKRPQEKAQFLPTSPSLPFQRTKVQLIMKILMGPFLLRNFFSTNENLSLVILWMVDCLKIYLLQVAFYFFSTTAFSFFLLGKKDLNLLNPGEDFPKGQSFYFAFWKVCGIDFLSFIAFSQGFSRLFFLWKILKSINFRFCNETSSNYFCPS